MAIEYYSHMPGTRRIRLLRGMVINGTPHGAGEIVDASTQYAIQFTFSGAAEYVQEQRAPALPVNRVLPDAQPVMEPPEASKAEAPKNEKEKSVADAAKSKRR